MDTASMSELNAKRYERSNSNDSDRYYQKPANQKLKIL